MTAEAALCLTANKVLAAKYFRLAALPATADVFCVSDAGRAALVSTGLHLLFGQAQAWKHAEGTTCYHTWRVVVCRHSATFRAGACLNNIPALPCLVGLVGQLMSRAAGQRWGVKWSALKK